MSQIPTEPPYAHTDGKRKSRRVWWIAGALLLVAILLGTCIKGGVDLFSAISARSEATVELVEKFMTEGLPSADDPVFARRAGVTPEAISKLQDLMDQFGPVSDFSAATCNMRSAANIDANQSGTFADCYMTASSELSPVNIYVGWVREDEVWKVLSLNVNYSDDSMLIEKAKELDRLAKEKEGASEEAPSEISQE